MRWRRINRGKRRALGDGRAVPDHNEEYLLYQTLVGAWPLEMPDAAARAEFTRRIQQYMVKAVHEAKVNLSWTNQNPEYVAALEQFMARILQGGTAGRPNLFPEQIENFVAPVAFFGCINSLAQTLLKLTSPGLPDVYQGTELWDFSLVDPDNRRPVDYQLRQRLLGDLLAAQGASLPELCQELLRDYKDGRMKMWTTLRALNLRREDAALFQTAGYTPLSGTGDKAEHLVAFAREHDWRMAITAVPRFAYTLYGGEPQLTPEKWGDTHIALPAQAPANFINVLTGERVQVSNRALSCREVFAHFPVALLIGG
jgi:(1->4)-alpha-D-glucan 1-alpha-D-glucosylmutase